MRFFEELIEEVRDFVEERRGNAVVEESAGGRSRWPAGQRGRIVMQADTAVELGHPNTASTAFHLWTTEADRVRDGRVTLIGPDLDRAAGDRLPFGKAVLLQVEDFDEENCYERHADIGRMRFDLLISGYMLRAVKQAGREWSRVSKEALRQGFSLPTLGHELVELYRGHPHVRAAEILLVTSSVEDVRALERIAERSERMVQAFNKMVLEMDFDCDSCDYTDVCNEAGSLQAMRRKLKEEKSDA